MYDFVAIFSIDHNVLGIGNFKGDRELKGYIDELYIFNRTLNATEISRYSQVS